MERGRHDPLFNGDGSDSLGELLRERTTPVTAFDASRQETIHRYPQFLPGGRHFLYAIMRRQTDQSGVYAASLDGTIKKRLIPVNTSAVYVPPGTCSMSTATR